MRKRLHIADPDATHESACHVKGQTFIDDLPSRSAMRLVSGPPLFSKTVNSVGVALSEVFGG